MFIFSALYNLVLIVLSILLLPIIIIALIAVPKLRAGFWSKLGFYPNFKLDKDKKTIFFHAVSVGEVNAIETLVKKTRDSFPDCNIVLSTTTKTGQEIANKKLKNTVDAITYFPFDFFFSVLSFLKSIKPDVIIIAETEIWPDFMYISKKQNIPVYIVNGRLSPHSYNGYKRFSFFFKPVLSLYEGIFMQTDEDKERMLSIGAPTNRTQKMGNLKYDIEPIMSATEVTKLAQSLELNDNKLIVAASTHKGEDEIIIDIFTNILNKYPDTKLMLAPRHPERYQQVTDLLEKSGLSYGKRSSNDTFDKHSIIMLDTMGELMKMYAISHFAFIGGSFSGTGGHNPLEANIWGKPVLSGDCVFNFKEIYNFLTQTTAAKLSHTPKELEQDMLNLLTDKTAYQKACEDTKTIFEENSGAVDFVITTLKNKEQA